jgi:hypothetical protein
MLTGLTKRHSQSVSQSGALFFRHNTTTTTTTTTTTSQPVKKGQGRKQNHCLVLYCPVRGSIFSCVCDRKQETKRLFLESFWSGGLSWVLGQKAEKTQRSTSADFVNFKRTIVDFKSTIVDYSQLGTCWSTTETTASEPLFSPGQPEAASLVECEIECFLSRSDPRLFRSKGSAKTEPLFCSVQWEAASLVAAG